MNKTLEIRVKDPQFNKDTVPLLWQCEHGEPHPHIYPIECTHILNAFENKDVNIENASKAIDFLIAYFAKNRYEYVSVDINARNISHAPAKEMTIEEIEEKLGYKVKIVKEKEADE